ncbi:alpha/beta fold hydrolase [Gynuella sunshinyii]|uniref:Putative hydrolase or acyltransferase (Alpha/beta hydrolase superfamily) n=1 Tax=Gynuella sunshinyii YC6258 TaxID=1445510 RepID=A0A0C5VNE1_9GAMM|nr:alpha/beta hydrolase [Gynuella sunshinyii]AJQ94903.1 putative hydrolase or acyltransferase (alpha/beta hydrolase superfamily) [Gynuella sunshinyii YC6258]
MTTSPTPKPSLVLLCGLLSDELVWQDIADSLHDIATISILNFRGFDSITTMAEHLLATTTGTICVAGHSMGGRVALEAYRLAPQRIYKMALLNSGMHPRKEKETAGRQQLLTLAAEQGMSAVADTWLPPMVGPAGQQNETLMTSLKQMVCRYSVQDFQKQITALLNRPDAQPLLSQITIPTLLICGEADRWSPVAQHQEMAACLPDSHLIALANCGHMSTIESPQEISQAFRNWLT